MTKIGPKQLGSMSKGRQLVRMEPQSEIWPVQSRASNISPWSGPRPFPSSVGYRQGTGFACLFLNSFLALNGSFSFWIGVSEMTRANLFPRSQEMGHHPLEVTDLYRKMSAYEEGLLFQVSDWSGRHLGRLLGEGFWADLTRTLFIEHKPCHEQWGRGGHHWLYGIKYYWQWLMDLSSEFVSGKGHRGQWMAGWTSISIITLCLKPCLAQENLSLIRVCLNHHSPGH